jgi:hypothetical protein
MPHVYKYIGNNAYKRIMVDDAEKYIKDGWYLSIADHQKPVEEVSEEPPTREEMEFQADKLGVKYDGRTGDKTLLKRINEAMQ